jgi:hypothetical protein
MLRLREYRENAGAALLLALLALLLLSLLGLFLSLSAATGVHISDNYESEVQATYAALAGLRHARVLFRGLALNDLLSGPDGTYDASEPYRAEARSYRFRMPLPLSMAQTLDVVDPASDVAGINDDGLINTGMHAGTPGTVLIPKTGIGQSAPNPYGAGTIVVSRYFVKVSDNNGEASETAGDSEDNPFIDGDGIVILRSIGVSRTFSERVGAGIRRNAVAVFETRLKRPSTWTVGSALVAIGSGITADLNGAFEISGGTFPGIATIDPISNDAMSPDRVLCSAAAASGLIAGGGIAHPSVQDITGQIQPNPDQSKLLNPNYLWDFTRNQAPRLADSFFSGSQNWAAGSAPYLGSYDPASPSNAPGQDPRITVVHGNLQISGGVSGGGLLIVTGDLVCSGPFAYSGLILVIGSGNLNLSGAGILLEGSVFAANLVGAGGAIGFGVPQLSISGDARLSSNAAAVRMAAGLIPPLQISFREVAGADP